MISLKLSLLFLIVLERYIIYHGPSYFLHHSPSFISRSVTNCDEIFKGKEREKGNTKLPFFQEGCGIRLQDQIDYGMNRGKRLGLSDLKEYISHFFNPKSNKTKTCDQSHLELHVYNSEVVWKYLLMYLIFYFKVWPLKFFRLHSSNPHLYKGVIEFLKFDNKGGNEIFSRKGGVGLKGRLFRTVGILCFGLKFL